MKKFYLTDLPDSLKFKSLKELKHKCGNAVDFVTRFKLYSTQLQIPEIVQLELFEDQVNPLVKKKLLDLEPQRRTIDIYSRMLITYDSERDRHWDNEATKRKGDSLEELNRRKKYKSWHKRYTPSRNNQNMKDNSYNSSESNAPNKDKPINKNHYNSKRTFSNPKNQNRISNR